MMDCRVKPGNDDLNQRASAGATRVSKAAG
jgi:hypothetical protein